MLRPRGTGDHGRAQPAGEAEGSPGMRELAARAYLHRANLGDRAAADAARVLVAEVDNPTLIR